MRNLLQYPVTQDEILASLRSQEESLKSEMRMGDMRPLVLRHSIEILEAAFALLKGFDERADQPGMGFVIPFREATTLIEACDFRIKMPAYADPNFKYDEAAGSYHRIPDPVGAEQVSQTVHHGSTKG